MTALVKLAPGVPAFAKNDLIVVAGVAFLAFFEISMAATLSYKVGLVIFGKLVGGMMEKFWWKCRGVCFCWGGRGGGGGAPRGGGGGGGGKTGCPLAGRGACWPTA